MIWLELVSGHPREPDDLDGVASSPGPAAFFDTLFAELVGRPLGPAVIEHEEEVSGAERTVRGRRGDEAAGIRFTEWTCLETSAIPMRCTWQSYGLPGIEVCWEFSLESVNVAGPCGFRHGRLRVGCSDAAARWTVEEVWALVFHEPPGFRPAG